MGPSRNSGDLVRGDVEAGRAGMKPDGMRVTGVMPAGRQKFLFDAFLID